MLIIGLFIQNASGSTIRSFINVLQSNEMPPTYNKSNKFTRGFQNLIDSYGMGSYREVNPGMYIIMVIHIKLMEYIRSVAYRT